MNYFRAFAHTTKKRQLISVDENYYSNIFNVVNNKPNDDYYESIYLYEQSHFDQFKKTNSLAGIVGLKTDRLVWDLDSKEDVSKAQNDTNTLILKLAKILPKEAIRIFYSGNKGFHVEVHLNQNLTRPEFENIVFGFGSGLPTLDQVVKDEQRLFRLPMTHHQTSKRYKIPLTIDQVQDLSVDQIQRLALLPEGTDEFYNLIDSWVTVDLPKELNAFKIPPKKEKTELVVNHKPDMSRKPKHLTAAKYVLQEGFFEDGERNEACMILASTYRHMGYNKDLAYNMLKSTLRLRCERLGHEGYDKSELWHTVVQPVYGNNWKGGTFNEDEGLLARVKARYKLTDTDSHERALVSLTSLTSSYRNFAANIDKNTVSTGLPTLDKNVRLTTSMLVALLAAPSAGKTATALGILNHSSLSSQKSLFFSLDMASNLIIQRLIQRHTGYDADKILDIYKNGVEKEIEKFEKILENEYKNVKFCFKSGITTGHIRDAILAEKERNGGEVPKMILIDYLECIRSEKSNDPTISKGFIASELKDIGNELECCIILLVQPAKVTGDPSQELLSYTNIKGSSVVAEAASIVLTMHRPGFSPKEPDDDLYATINVVKNRMGKLGSYDFNFDGLTGRLTELTSEDRNHLKALREEIAKQKAEANSSKGGFDF